MAHEQNAVVNQAPKELDYKAKETRYKDEGRSQEAVENTRPQGSFTNTVLVDEVKEIAHDAVEKFDKEEGGITEKELEEAINNSENKFKYSHNMFVGIEEESDGGYYDFHFCFVSGSKTQCRFEDFLLSKGYVDTQHLFRVFAFNTSEYMVSELKFYYDQNTSKIKVNYIMGSNSFADATVYYEQDTVIENG